MVLDLSSTCRVVGGDDQAGTYVVLERASDMMAGCAERYDRRGLGCLS